MEFRVKRAARIDAEITVPGDKSISHRAVIIAALSNGVCVLRGFLASEDCMCTVQALRACGIKISDAEQMNSRRAWNLRQIHRAEFASTDQADPDWIARGDALLQETIEIHTCVSARPINAMFGDIFFTAKWGATILTAVLEGRS